MVDLADRVGAAVLAPLFPAGIVDPNDSHNHKFVRYGDVRYDLILPSTIDEGAQRWPGIEAEKFYLVGFSGGGQFVSRSFYLHSRRLKRVGIGSPETVTNLNRSLEWPRGIKNVEERFDSLAVDIRTLRSVEYV